ncbi:MAG: hypothetical protein MR567_04730 [Oscillospiraceae bacterium]|nr:hypothetical protein [Oscillospiraceae bacterium]
MNTQKEKKRWLILVIVGLLILSAALAAVSFFYPDGSGARDSTEIQSGGLLGTVRNARIDRLLATVKKTDDCPYSDEDIDSAVRTVKESFQEKPWFVSLQRIWFDEEESESFLDGYHLCERYGKSDIITIGCDYYIYQDEEAWQSGAYDGWSVILTRENKDSEWIIADQGY